MTLWMAKGDNDGNDEATGGDGGGERATSAEDVTSAEVEASLRFAEVKISGARNSVVFESALIGHEEEKRTALEGEKGSPSDVCSH